MIHLFRYFVVTVFITFLLLAVIPSKVFSSQASDAADKDFYHQKFDKALSEYKSLKSQSTSKENTDDLNYKIAECHFQLGHKEEAISGYRTCYAESSDPSNKLKAGQKLVFILNAEDQYEEAFQKANEICHNYPDNPLSTSVAAYGAHSAWRLHYSRGLSVNEWAEMIWLFEKFKKEYSNSVSTIFLNSSHNAFDKPSSQGKNR